MTAFARYVVCMNLLLLCGCYQRDKELRSLIRLRKESRKPPRRATMQSREQADMAKIYAAVRSDNPNCRIYAIKLIAEDDRRDLLGTVIPLLQDPERQVRWNAIDVLAHFGTDAEISVLQEVLSRETDVALRRAVLNALILISKPGVLPILVDLLRDQDENIVQNAARGLTLLTGRPYDTDHEVWRTWLDTEGIPGEVRAQNYRFVPDWKPKEPLTPSEMRKRKSVSWRVTHYE